MALSTTRARYTHEIPGGQYTNLLFQSKQLGLGDSWSEIKDKYREANLLLGDIPKVVGDLAQFMVSQKLSPEQVVEQAETLAFPESVIQYFQGQIGVPPGGFPEPLTSRILKGRGLSPVDGRPGASLPDYDFADAEAALQEKYDDITPQDVLSHALYPKVFEDWQTFKKVYGDVEVLSTDIFLKPMKEGQEVLLETVPGRRFYVKMVAMPPPDANGCRKVIMELNGEQWVVPVTDNSAAETSARREQAVAEEAGSVGAPMPGVVVGVKVQPAVETAVFVVKPGDAIQEGEPLLVLSAMKMETVLPAPRSGVVDRLLVNAGDQVEGNDLILTIVDK